MLDWLIRIFGGLWAAPQFFMLFLGVPLMVSLVLTLAMPRRLGASVATVPIALVISLVVYLAIYLRFYAKGPTAFSIDLGLALISQTIACTITVAVVRVLQRAISRRNSPTSKR